MDEELSSEFGLIKKACTSGCTAFECILSVPSPESTKIGQVMASDS